VRRAAPARSGGKGFLLVRLARAASTPRGPALSPAWPHGNGIRGLPEKAGSPKQKVCQIATNPKRETISIA
jgi:hypothetical protein